MNVRPIFAIACLGMALVLAGCGGQKTPLVDDTSAQNAAPDATQAPASQETSVIAEGTESAEGQEGQEENPISVAPPVTPMPDIVAKVGDKEITAKEFERDRASHMQMMQSRSQYPIPVDDDLNSMVLRSVIDAEILGQLAAQDVKSAITDEEVNTEFASQKSRVPSEEAYQQYLKDQNLTEDDLRQAIRTRMQNDKYIDAMTADLAVTDEEMQEKYDALAKGGHINRPDETTDVAHILVKVEEGADEAAWADAKTRIDAARTRILAGESFAAVAKEVSEDPGSAQNGGEYKDVQKGRMVPEFEEAMLKTPVGQVSEPFRTTYGWHILEVQGKHAAGTMTLDEIHEPLKQSLLQIKRAQVVNERIAEARKNMNVEVYYLKDKVFADKSKKPDAQAADGGEAAAEPTTETTEATEEEPAATSEAPADAAAQPSETPEDAAAQDAALKQAPPDATPPKNEAP